MRRAVASCLVAALAVMLGASKVSACSIVYPIYTPAQLAAFEHRRAQNVSYLLREDDMWRDLQTILVANVLHMTWYDDGDCSQHPAGDIIADIQARYPDVNIAAIHYHDAQIMALRARCNDEIGRRLIGTLQRQLGDQPLRAAWRTLVPLTASSSPDARLTTITAFTNQVLSLTSDSAIQGNSRQSYATPHGARYVRQLNGRHARASIYLTSNPNGRTLMEAANQFMAAEILPHQGNQEQLCPGAFAEQQRFMSTLRRN